jgi:hypothetical protein
MQHNRSACLRLRSEGKQVMPEHAGTVPRWYRTMLVPYHAGTVPRWYRTMPYHAKWQLATLGGNALPWNGAGTLATLGWRWHTSHCGMALQY